MQGMRFARQLRQAWDHPFRVTHSPLIQPIFLYPPLSKKRYHAVVFTSETGATAAEHYADLPRLAYCVGDQTARAARRAGFFTQSAVGDADALIHMILQASPNQPLLHICGTDTRGDVAQRLNDARIQTDALIAYRQEPSPLTKDAARILAGRLPVIVPLFSPRTAKIFVADAEPIATAPLYITAFSPAVAAAVGTLTMANLITAATPTAEAMITAIQQIADTVRVA